MIKNGFRLGILRKAPLPRCDEAWISHNALERRCDLTRRTVRTALTRGVAEVRPGCEQRVATARKGRSQIPAHGSQLTSWPHLVRMAFSQITDHGSQLTDRLHLVRMAFSQITDHGSQLTDRLHLVRMAFSQITDHGSQLTDRPH